MRRRTLILCALLALVLVVAWWFRELIVQLACPSTFTAALGDKAAAGSVLGNIVGGLFTLTAGTTVIGLYLIQERQQNVTQVITWMSDLAKQFHEDKDFCEVRETAAGNRATIRDNIFTEMLLDDYGALVPPHAADALRARQAKSGPLSAQMDWKLVRKLTDYIYFFERVLAYGELSKGALNPGLCASIVDHFGWCMRSLFQVCVLADDTPEQASQARIAFVWYLATGRYRRLAEVGLYLLQEDPCVSRARLAELAKEICAVLQSQRSGIGARNLEDIIRTWEPILYKPAPTRH